MKLYYVELYLTNISLNNSKLPKNYEAVCRTAPATPGLSKSGHGPHAVQTRIVMDYRTSVRPDSIQQSVQRSQ